GPLPRLRRCGPLRRGRPLEPLRPGVVGARHAEGPPPVVDRALRSGPPGHDRRRRLVADGAGQLVIDQQPGTAPVGAGGAAARPGDAGVAPAGDDHLAVAELTERAVPALEGRRAAGAGVQPVADGPAHATTPTPSAVTPR